MTSDFSITGIASGINTSDIVTKLMSIESQPLVQMQNTQTTLQTQHDAWRDLNTQLLSLKGTVDALQDPTTFTSQAATSADATVITATTGTGAISGTYNVQVAKLATADRVVSTASVADANQALSSQVAGFQAGEITVGGAIINVQGTDTLNNLAANINQAQTNVVATVINNRLVLTSGQTGSANQLSVSTAAGAGLFNVSDGSTSGNPASNVLSQLGLYSGTTFSQYLSTAGDADFYINGIEGRSSSNTVTNAVNGLSITLNGVSQTVASTGNPTQDLKATTLQVTTDTQKAAAAVKAFVDQYNSVMSFIDSKTSFNSQTNTAGDLFGDSMVMEIQQSLREMVGGIVPGANAQYNTLATIGISTTGEAATLSFDQTKLTTALNSNPAAVTALFGSTASGSTGVASTMSSMLDNLTMFNTGLIPGRENSLDSQIQDLKNQMDDFQQQLDLRQQTLEAQFNAMEQAISGFKNQGTALTSMLTQLPSTQLTQTSSTQ